MDWYVMFALVLGVAGGLLFLGVPVFVAFTLINLLGIYTLLGWVARVTSAFPFDIFRCGKLCGFAYTCFHFPR